MATKKITDIELRITSIELALRSKPSVSYSTGYSTGSALSANVDNYNIIAEAKKIETYLKTGK